MSKPRVLPEKPSFENAVSEIEAIVARIEAGDLSLEESLAAYRRGAELLKHCQGQLDEAEFQLRVLDEDSLKPFEPPQEDAR
jgi:exodeoxyribonuclease VII small subunit